jgi:hypothetical protein
MSAVPAAQMATTSIVDNIILSLNSSPYVSSTMMLLLNFGGRFLGLELTKGQEKFFSHPYVRRFLIFCVMFVATRNLLIAVWMTLLIILIVGYLTNENSALCLFGRAALPSAKCAEGFTGGAAGAAATALTPEEETILKMLLDKKARLEAAAAAASAPGSDAALPTKKNTDTLVRKYKENISKLNDM